MQRIVRTLSYSNVVATLALFVALGGSATAATVLITGSQVKNGSLSARDLAPHTIGARQLKRDAVTGAFVRNDSLTGFDIRDGTIRAVDFLAADLAQLRGSKGDTGATGPSGPQGAAGPQGPSGTTYTTIAAAAPDVSNLGAAQTILSHALAGAGVYLVSGRLRVTNSSGGPANIFCGTQVEGTLLPSTGGTLADGQSTTFHVPYVYTIEDPSSGIQLVCDSGGAPPGISVTDIHLNLFKFA